jgi:ubiquinone/menaquinone biosynthesis C-methylase UbiE
MLKITGGNTLVDANLILHKANIGQAMHVADLGCGNTGYFVFLAAKIVGRHGKVYAVDIQKTVLASVTRRVKQENADNVETVWSNLEIFNAAKIESGSLDAALLINTLYQSHKRPEIIRETVRMLKKGGRLVIVEWKNLALPFGPPPSERVNQRNLIIAAPKLGLELEDEFTAGQCHYGLVFVKL